MVFVTAGTGHFDVDKKLLRITTERMIENGTGLDLVCLTKMPLHSVPLFHFKSHYPDPSELKQSQASRTQRRATLGWSRHDRPSTGSAPFTIAPLVFASRRGSAAALNPPIRSTLTRRSPWKRRRTSTRCLTGSIAASTTCSRTSPSAPTASCQDARCTRSK